MEAYCIESATVKKLVPFKVELHKKCVALGCVVLFQEGGHNLC